MSYWRFAAMIATSTVVMFGLMYLNTFAFEHVLWSETRAWMAVIMGATMAVIMLGYMLSMYSNTRVNVAIFAAAIIAFAASLWLVRSQATIDDSDFMSAMIPHHSIAVMTSKRAGITDPRVRKLADEIIAAQEREIAEMKYLIGDIADAGEASDPALGEDEPQVASAAEVLEGVRVATLDPAKLTAAEIGEVLDDDGLCVFRYTSESEPALAFAPNAEGGEAGVIKLNGDLVPMSAASDDGMPAFEAGEIRIALSSEQQAQGWDADQNEATMIFAIGERLRVGYGGYINCP